MDSITVLFRTLFVATTVLFYIPSASTLDCSPSLANIKCDCTATKVQCFGTQIDIFEAENILKNISKAESIIFQINDLQFESDFVIEVSSIKNLTLGYTKYGLHVLSANLFSKLNSSLISLNLQNNSIRKIDDYFFADLPVLTELFLDNNEVENLTLNTFTSLNNLKYLSLSFNNISDITLEVFENLILLENLVLSHNKLLSIENANIKSATLIELRIDNCLIEGLIHKNTLEHIPNTEKLDISYNAISGIESHSLSSLKNLKHLNLSYNVIEYLDENAFSNIYNLTLLDLQGNRISVIKISAFDKLQNLKYLDLSGNKLKAVLCEYTADFISLERIYLQNNEIKTFTTGAFFYSPKLKVLDMTGNTLECTCPLTESAHYLIENGTMDSSDLDSIPCIIPSTGSQLPITKYKSSKCVPVEPCKRIELTDEEEYEDDYEEFTTNSTTQTTTDIISLDDSTTQTTTDIISLGDSTTLTPTTQSTFSKTETGSTMKLLMTTTEYNASNTLFSSASTTTSLEESTTPIFTAPSILNETETTLTTTAQSIFNETETSSTIKLSVTTIGYNASNSHSSTESTKISLEESTTATFTTLSIFNETETYSTMKLLTPTEYNASNTTTTMANNTTSEEVTIPFVKTSEQIFTESISANSYEEPNTTLPFSSEVTTANTITVSTTENLILSSSIKTSKIIIPQTESDCSALQLHISNVSISSDLKILKNFSNKNSNFCLKWTAGSNEGLKLQRCLIKYTTTAGTKVLNLQCPSYAYEIKEWNRKEKIFKFCITIYPEGKRKQDSCELLVSQRSTTISNFVTTTPYVAITSVTVKSTESTTDKTSTLLDETTTDSISTTYVKSTSVLDKNRSGTTFVTPNKTIEDTTFPEITAMSSTVHPTDFSIIALDLYFNHSKFVFAKWTVNKWQPSHVCNMTLMVSTQYFDEMEGTFPCKSNTYRLTKVKEDEIFKVCLFSYHVISGQDNLCDHTLPSAKASTSKDDSLNSSLIPLICLLICVGLLILILALRNIYKRRSVSQKYDVRAEEQKYEERTKLRPQSVHDESVRFSYILKENHESA